jgi:ADP-ribose pyrophosphatase YjhB (NUDIX family)
MSKRSASRTVVVDKDNNIAVLSVRGGMYHKIPGGGVKEGETEEQAAIREAREEAFCDVEIVETLGELKFTDPGEISLIHYSTGFLAKKISDNPEPNAVYDEQERGFTLEWLSFEEAIKKFEQVETKNAFELAMNNRDLEFIKMAQVKIK